MSRWRRRLAKASAKASARASAKASARASARASLINRVSLCLPSAGTLSFCVYANPAETAAQRAREIGEALSAQRDRLRCRSSPGLAAVFTSGASCLELASACVGASQEARSVWRLRQLAGLSAVRTLTASFLEQTSENLGES